VGRGLLELLLTEQRRVVIFTQSSRLRTERDLAMLVLSTRLNEKVHLPDSRTTIEVVAIQSGTVRLGISAPEEVRILRQGIPDRVAEWGIDPDEAAEEPALQRIKRLLDKRLEIAHKGLNEAQRCLLAGNEEDANVLIEKVDEDLHMLRRRLRREVEKTEALSCGV
jgi:carbon storage regulator CsrA